MELHKAMQEIADINEKGGKGTENLKGKTYTKVSTRVEVFRKYLGTEYGIETAPLFPANGGVFMQAWVKDKEGFILGTGHSYAQSVSKEKGIEKLESVAIGRAMASIGLAGGEYASDNEMESWQERYSENTPKKETPPKIHMEMGADDVAPETWANSKIEGIYLYIEKPKSTLAKLADADRKSREDPIFLELNEEQRDTYEIAIKDAENKLKQRLKEKEAA